MKSDQAYASRLAIFEKVLGLESPERVLSGPFSEHFFSTKQAGITNAEAMVDHQKRFSAMKDSVLRYGFDFAPASGVYPAQLYDALAATYFKWPGGDLPDDQPFQFIEKEYMLEQEYDAFLANPNDFSLRVLWPRMAHNLAPFAEMPPLFSIGPDPIFLGGFFGTQEGQSVLDSLKKLGAETASSSKAEAAYAEEMKGLGYPLAYAANFTPPFDRVADYLRGLRGVLLDMYRAPEKLLAATELFVRPQIEAAIAWAKEVGNPRVVFWLHRGAAGFMSNVQYERFYWPSLRTVVSSLVEADLTPILHVQGDYTPRLPFLAELPRGKVPIHYDRVDREQAKRIMGGRQCFWGNVASSVLVTGSPKQVEQDVKELVDFFAPEGGLIVDGNLGIPDEARPENVEAMLRAVDTYGAG